ncbi:MAG: Ig-like domain-containing protein, partial [Bacteroidales bacterium]|nr:Ig-like domain-containing protein [Bacteroidales bacterium]
MKIRMYPALFTGFLFSFFVYANGQTVDAVTTITWPHDTPDDPVATYSENTGDYFKPDYVSLGSNLNYLRVRESNGETFRTYQPNSQTGSGPDNVIGFHIWPVTGLSFTPTHVSFKAQRYGTDSGLLDVKWKSSDGTGVVIATALKPARDNSGSFTSADYDLSGLTIPASDGECALQIILYDLGNTKEVGLADIVLTGTISGTIIQVTTYKVATSVSPEGAGTITSFPVGNTFDEGTEITLTATKNFGYEFSHWADASDQTVSSDNPYTFTLNENVELKAVFNKLNTYSLNVAVDGGATYYMISYSPEGTMVNDQRMYEEGSNVTLTAHSNPILTFTNWGSGETTADLTITMDGDKEITAIYNAVDYIVGWDFYLPGNQGRVADFYSTDDNQSAALILRNADGITTSWLDKSTVAAGGYEAAEGAAVNWTNLADKYYYQISFNAAEFTDITVSADMLYNYNVYSVQKCEYSLDGTSFNTLGTYTMNPPKTLIPGTFDLPADANNAPLVYIRWIPDYTSAVVGSTSEKDGTTISAIYVTGTPEIVNDGTAPLLVSTVPVDDATGVTATGKVVLTFDEKVQIAENTTATLGSFELIPVVIGRTITFSYVGLDYNTEYTFTLAGGTVADLSGNTLSDPISVTFTTLDKPIVTKKAYDFIVGRDGNFAEALAAAEAASSGGNRFFIFFPDGEYDIGTLTGDANEMT